MLEDLRQADAFYSRARGLTEYDRTVLLKEDPAYSLSSGGALLR
jgi:hypothetical protein